MSMAKTKTAKKAAAKQKVSMEHVISFRVTDAQYKALQAIFGKDSIVGVRSERQFARKVVCDFVNGKLKYVDPKDRLVDTAAYGG